MSLVTDDEASEVLQPSKQPLDFPAPAAASKAPSVLSLVRAITAVRRNQFDPMAF